MAKPARGRVNPVLVDGVSGHGENLFRTQTGTYLVMLTKTPWPCCIIKGAITWALRKMG